MSHPESVPFLLTRPPSSDASFDDDETSEEIPASRSVPPHAPPPRVHTDEADLPSVIVDVKALEREEAVLRVQEMEEEEAQRASDVDVLLAESEEITRHDLTTQIYHPPSKARGVAIAMLFALVAAGGTFAGLRAHGVSARAVGAALHLAH